MNEIFELQNPWRKPTYVFPVEKAIPRTLLVDLKQSLASPEISVVIGARQVGKTFLLRQLIRSLTESEGCDRRQIFYFDLDSFPLISFVQNLPEFIRFIEALGVPEKTSYIFFDEAQRLPNCGLTLKQYYDLARPIKFIVSGSSTLEIKSQVRETLVGRKRVFHLRPVSFMEAAAFWGFEFASASLRQLYFENEKALHYLQRYLKYGGYPAVVCAEDESQRIRLLSEIYQSYVQKDISDFLKVEDVAGFNRLVVQLAAGTAQLLNIHELSKVTRLSRYFVDKYLQMLRDTYVIDLVLPYFSNIGKAVVKMPKLFFADLGLRNSIQYQSLLPATFTEMGHLAENFVYSELANTLPSGNLWFWRTPQGTEIDFIYQAGGEITPIEVKFQEAETAVIPKAIRSFAEAHKVSHAIVLTKKLWSEKKDGKLIVRFMPVWMAAKIPEILKMDKFDF
ncbi:MAG: ATP-binding protein [candidate division KSB1 bacterium]|nr:ATP-binding protein [candidate division KSB1 bacterium]MDZ7303201.1 ATP-binding protein [candidate division KSB1 bacterium]MDZ7312187.1 ATP-binding protein [candidate division KSB1 bacterium]